MTSIIKKLNELGYHTIDSSWYDRIAVWDAWYKGNVTDFHTYKVFNGHNPVKCTRYSLGMGKKVSEDWANLLMNEKVKITIEGNKEQAFVDRVFTDNDFTVNINELQEKGAARGTYAIVPHVTGATINANGKVVGADGIALDYITADCIFPLSWKGRNIKECAFATMHTVGADKYLYMQLHVMQGYQYAIINKLYKENNGTLQEALFDEVMGFEGVTDAPILTGSEKPQFVIGRYNIANNIEENNPMGIAVFANAIDVLKGVDVAYDSYVNEFVLGKKRIMVKPSATKNIDGESVFDPADMAYYVLPEDISNGTIIQPIDMNLRTVEHSQGLQDNLNILSSKCGFGEQYYKFDHGSIATATQIVSENSTLFRSIKKHEIILESLLVNLCRSILRIGNNYMSAGLNEDVEISVDFDDSIIENRERDEARVYQMLAAGLMMHEEARSILMNEDIDTARAALPGMDEMTDETQNEVE